MLGLKDFVHLPEVEPYFEKVVGAGPGLVTVAGLDPRPHAAGSGVAPSGRATIFRILARQMIEVRKGRSLVAGDRALLHLPRRLARRVSFHPSTPAGELQARIAEAKDSPPMLLVLERLDAATVPAVTATVARGGTVLSQLDTVFRGAAVVTALAELDLSLSIIGPVVSVQRLPTLCPACKEARAASPAQLEVLARRYPGLKFPAGALFNEAPGCEQCAHSGRQGQIAAFDLYAAGDSAASFPLERYLLRLAVDGYLSLSDLFELDEGQLLRTYRLLGASERALEMSNATLARRLAELESAHQVLQRQTQTLISLQDLSQALIAGSDPADLALRVCQHSCELSGADRAILYYFEEGRAGVLAAHGWLPSDLPPAVETAELALSSGPAPVDFNRWPPGIAPRNPNVAGFALYAGLAVPLEAQAERVGLLLLHSERQDAFAPGERSLLQTFANQAALALQRVGLVDRLREKVAALEAAQAALAQKERLERDLELARQVQESMLPRTFPRVEGFRFAAHSRPARHVGGDFYDVILLDDGHFGVAIADVSDKGLPAALYMALTRSLLLAESGRSRSPAAVLARVNDLLLKLGEGEMFVTLFYGIVNAGGHTLHFARAGHDRPFHFRGREYVELDGPGTALGILPTPTLRLADVTVTLTPGDRLFLYSDGLTDVVSATGALFDRQRLAARFRAHAALPLADCCTQTFADLDAFQGSAEQHDDMTLLAVELEVGREAG